MCKGFLIVSICAMAVTIGHSQYIPQTYGGQSHTLPSQTPNTTFYAGFMSNDAVNYPASYGSIFGYTNHNNGYGYSYQIFKGHTVPRLHIRFANYSAGDAWYDWKYLFDSGNDMIYQGTNVESRIKGYTHIYGRPSDGILHLHAGTSNGPVFINYNETGEVILANGGGNVGIGTTNPERKLTVNGDIKSHGLMIRDDVATDLWMYRDPDVGDWSLLRSNKGNGIALIGQVDVVALAVSRATSNVLIGKTSQTNTTYKLDVAGKVRANEIVVNTTGADYVFDEDYKLKTLSEVETYIQENGHLPDIPSAEEMQTNGMAVGELNTKLLEKVEELTLYVIELKKDNESLKARNTYILKELENLKSKDQ